jgi:hypothetical protein
VVGGDRVDPVALLGAGPDQAGPVPKDRAERTDRRRGDPRLGQQVRAQQLGLLLRQRRASTPPAPTRKTLPRGSGSFAVIRALVGLSSEEDEEPGAIALAAQAGVSQPRASQILRQLHELGLVHRSGHGRWEPRREALLDRFLAEYPGPGGSEQYYYSLDSSVDVAIRAGRASTQSRPIVASADVGPDLILAWRRPSLVILYAKYATDPSGLALTEAQGRHDANVIMRTPQDRSVFPASALVAQVQGSDVPLADPLQQIWDLQDLGGADRIEAAGRLRQWLLEHPMVTMLAARRQLGHELTERPAT